jgi:hypothetical protein
LTERHEAARLAAALRRLLGRALGGLARNLFLGSHGNLLSVDFEAEPQSLRISIAKLHREIEKSSAGGVNERVFLLSVLGLICSDG